MKLKGLKNLDMYKFKKALVPMLSIRKKARKKKAKQIETSWGTKNLLPTVMRSFCAMLLPLLTKDPSKSMNFYITYIHIYHS